MQISVSNKASRPLYEQIVTQIKAQIMSGELQSGEALPSIRSLAKSLHISVLTVQKAYDQLSQEGFIETTAGKGCYVSAQNQDFYLEEQQKRIEEHFTEAIEIARESGIDLEHLTSLLTTMMNALTISDVSKTYPGFTLDHVSFSVPQGAIVGLIGENGAGKSTILNATLGLISKESGTINILGSDILDNATKEQVGVVFDGSGYPDVMAPRTIGRILANVYESWDAALYEKLLERFGLPKDKALKKFSKGMKMKFAITAAMAHRPKLLVLDEATSGLDPVVRDDILDMLLDFVQKEDHSVLVSSHITSDLEKIADYIVFLHEGKIAFTMPKDELVENYGILQCGAAQFDALDKDDIVRFRRMDYEWQVLVADRAAAERKYPKAMITPATIDEIMLMFVKGEK